MEKIYIIVDNDIGGGGSSVIDNPDADIIEWYGIEVNIRCDYSKHPKYSEWKNDYYSNSEEYGSLYYFRKYMDREFYELIEDYFPNVSSHSFWPGSEIININFSARKIGDERDMEAAQSNMESFVEAFYKTEDYNNLIKLASEEYITGIGIIERWPRRNGDDSIITD